MPSGFVKGADYIRGTQAQLAFVSTNSVAQGEHVALMFPTILSGGIETGYAYTSFKWENNAKRNAGVTVVVISLRNISQSQKFIFSDGLIKAVNNINPYLSNGGGLVIRSRRNPLSNHLSGMTRGQPTDGGALVLSETDKEGLLQIYPEAVTLLKSLLVQMNLLKEIFGIAFGLKMKTMVKSLRLGFLENALVQLKNGAR